MIFFQSANLNTLTTSSRPNSVTDVIKRPNSNEKFIDENTLNELFIDTASVDSGINSTMPLTIISEVSSNRSSSPNDLSSLKSALAEPENSSRKSSESSTRSINDLNVCPFQASNVSNNLKDRTNLPPNEPPIHRESSQESMKSKKKIIKRPKRMNHRSISTEIAENIRIPEEPYIEDLSGGLEVYKIPVYNCRGEEDTINPINYVLLQVNHLAEVPKFRRQMKKVYHDWAMHPDGCECPPGKCEEDCPCIQMSEIIVKDRSVHNLDDLLNSTKGLRFVECRASCKCRGKCGHQMTTFHTAYRIRVMNCGPSGYGVYTDEFIDTGKYFGEYTGNVAARDWAVKRQNIYQYELKVTAPNVGTIF